MGFEDQDHHAGGYQGTIGLAVTLAAAFSFAVLIIIIIIIRFYARHRQRRRYHDLLYLMSTQIAPTNVNSSEPPNSGSGPVIIASLSKILYKQTDQFSQGELMECSVCLGTIVEDAAIRVLPNCKHMFHVDFVDMWFSSNCTSPVCRTVAEPRVQLDMGFSGLRTAAFPRMVITKESSLRRNHSYDGSAVIGDREKQ